MRNRENFSTEEETSVAKAVEKTIETKEEAQPQFEKDLEAVVKYLNSKIKDFSSLSEEITSQTVKDFNKLRFIIKNKKAPV
ncbi:MAG: hypothetical protein HYT36_03805 [Candidatus Staskawiczbacteria bacterium]|nr:hypothetical protein [Candidatus Staskawiczbacteria bacterium]